MTLKVNYNFNEEMNLVYNLGFSLIQALPTPTPAYTTLNGALAAASKAGKKIFTVNLSHNAINANLELKGEYWETYKTGIQSSLSQEDIYCNEVTVELNTSVAGTATIDLKFNF